MESAVLNTISDPRKVAADRRAVSDQRATTLERHSLHPDDRTAASQRLLQQANQGRGPVPASREAADASVVPKKRNIRQEIESEFESRILPLHRREYEHQRPPAPPPPLSQTSAESHTPQHHHQQQTARASQSSPAEAPTKSSATHGDEESRLGVPKVAVVAQPLEKVLVDKGVGIVDDAAAAMRNSTLWKLTQEVYPTTLVEYVQSVCHHTLFACAENAWVWPTQDQARPLEPLVPKTNWPKIPLHPGVWPSPGCDILRKHLRVVLLQGETMGGCDKHPAGIPVIIHRPTCAAFMLWSHAAAYVGVDLLTLRNMGKMAIHNSTAILGCMQAVHVEGAAAEVIIAKACEKSSLPQGLNPRRSYTKERSVMGLPLLVAMLRALRDVEKSCTVKMRDGALAV